MASEPEFFSSKVKITFTNSNPKTSLPNYTLPGWLLVLNPVCNLYFYILLQPPNIDKTSVVYPLLVMELNLLYFPFYTNISKDLLHTKTRLLTPLKLSPCIYIFLLTKYVFVCVLFFLQPQRNKRFCDFCVFVDMAPF